MKVSIITILDNINFGTYLQAIALAKTIEKSGVEVEFVNYHREKSLLPALIGRILADNKKSVIAKIYGLLRLMIKAICKFKIRRFLKKYVNLTSRKYRSIEELRQYVPNADVYITGSDQVWNYIYNEGIDRSFFLDFVPENKRKYSYAASLGIDQMPETDSKMIFELLSSFDLITVRESFSVEVLRRLGISNIDYVLDPTFLLSKNEWINLVGGKFKKTEKYLLVYSVEGFDKVFEIAGRIAKEKGLKVYFISHGGPLNLKRYHIDKLFLFASCNHFVDLFANADFAVVSSFHGTAFSINFNVPFFTILPDRFNIRILSILELLSLRHRALQYSDIELDLKNTIDFENVNLIIKQERARSLSLLSLMIA